MFTSQAASSWRPDQNAVTAADGLRTRHRAIAAIGGGRSALFVCPDDDLAVVVLTNLQRASPETFVDTIANHFFGATQNARSGRNRPNDR